MEGLIVLLALLLIAAPFAGLGLALHALSRIGSFERRLREIEAALARLTTARAAAPIAAPPVTEPAPAAPVVPAVEPARPAPVVPAATPPRWAAPAPAPPAPPPTVRPAAPVAPVAPEADEGRWAGLERRLGGTWLNRIGAIVLTLGVGFFLKYAFDRQWISPATRIGLGVVAGLALIVVGERLMRAAYRAPAQGVVAVGVATLYLSVYAAYGFYQLVSQAAAFGCMVLVTGGGLALALRHDARALAILATIGGFLTPVVLSTGRDAGRELFTYLAVLDAGMLAAAYFRRWPELGLLSFAGTQILYAAWWAQWYRDVPGQQGVAFVSASVFLVLFSLVAPMETAARAPAPRPEALWRGPGLLALAAPAAYFLAAREILRPQPLEWLSLLCLALAAYHAVLGLLAARARVLGGPVLVLEAAVALAFVTIAAPVYFDGHAVAIAWSVEGMVIVCGGALLVRTMLVRAGGLVVLTLAVVRWLLLLTERAPHTGVLAADHPAMPATVALTAALALAALAYRALALAAGDGERYVGPALALGAIASPALLLTVELGQHRALRLGPGEQATLTALVWLAAAVLMLALATADATRLLAGFGALVLLGVGLLAVAGDMQRWQSAAWTPAPGLLSLRFGAGLLITAVYAGATWIARGLSADRETRAAVRAFGTAATALFLLWHLSLEVVLMPLEASAPGELTMVRHTALSVLWTLYAFAAMGLGIQRRLAPLRFGAIGLFAVTVVKVFLVDLSRLDAGYRILSFVVLGGLLILASFLYTRFRDRIASRE